MDLVVLIDDENAGLDSGHLVQMMGDLLERVSSSLTSLGAKLMAIGNKLCRQAITKSEDTNPQAQSRSVTSSSFR
jgi:hypothetical protein